MRRRRSTGEEASVIVPIDETQVLLLATALTPLVIMMYRAIGMRPKRWLGGYAVAMMTAYLTTVLEEYFAPTLVNGVEHLAYAAAGICWLTACVLLTREPLPDEGRE